MSEKDNKIYELELRIKDRFFAKNETEAKKEMVVVERFRSELCTKKNRWIDSHEISFHISTTTLSAKTNAKGIRLHWGTENKNHHVKDVTLLEDASRIRKVPESMGRLRSFTLNILRTNDVKNISQTLYENALDMDVIFNYYGVS